MLAITGLIISVISMAIGPLCSEYLLKRKRLYKKFTIFLFLILLGIIFIKILPALYRETGIEIILYFACGYFLPIFFEKIFIKKRRRLKKITLFFIFTAIALHSFLEGGAIMQTNEINIIYFSTAVFLHRIPVSMSIWWFFLEIFNKKSGIIALVFLVFSTLLGAYISESFSLIMPKVIIAYFNSLVAGSLIHLIRTS